MTIKNEVIALNKIDNKEILKIMNIEKHTKIEYIYGSLLNCMFRYDKLRIYIIGVKKKGEKSKK